MSRELVQLDGERLNALRLQAGLNRTELAFRAGLCVNTVRKAIEQRPISLSVGQSLARVFAVEFGDLLPAPVGNASTAARGAETPHHAEHQAS